jgi:hypothetical protein
MLVYIYNNEQSLTVNRVHYVHCDIRWYRTILYGLWFTVVVAGGVI